LRPLLEPPCPISVALLVRAIPTAHASAGPSRLRCRYGSSRLRMLAPTQAGSVLGLILRTPSRTTVSTRTAACSGSITALPLRPGVSTSTSASSRWFSALPPRLIVSTRIVDSVRGLLLRVHPRMHGMSPPRAPPGRLRCRHNPSRLPECRPTIMRCREQALWNFCIFILA
jgi:hypothetical protein